MPPPSLSTTTKRGVDAAVARTEQAVAVVQEAEVAEQRDGRTRRTPAAMPSDGRHEAVDAVDAAVGEHVARRRAARRSSRRRARACSTRRRATPPSGTAATTSRAMRPSNGSSQPSSRPSIAARAGASASVPRRRTHRRRSAVTSSASASATSSSSASASIRPLTACVRVEPRAVGIDRAPGRRRHRATASRPCW